MKFAVWDNEEYPEDDAEIVEASDERSAASRWADDTLHGTYFEEREFFVHVRNLETREYFQIKIEVDFEPCFNAQVMRHQIAMNAHQLDAYIRRRMPAVGERDGDE